MQTAFLQWIDRNEQLEADFGIHTFIIGREDGVYLLQQCTGGNVYQEDRFDYLKDAMHTADEWNEILVSDSEAANAN